MDFKPGLNLILGANTSGKTSILESIQSYVGYTRDFWSEKQHLDLIKNYHKSIQERYNVDIKGGICKYLSYKPEELKEVTDFEYNTQSDFKTRVMSNFQSRGEGRRSYHDHFINYVQQNYMFTPDELKTLKENYDGDIDIKTLLITADEPENSMAINMQFGLFDWFYEFAKVWGDRVQIIVATHSVAAFKMAQKNLPDVNIIELNKGWVKRINKQIYG
jgi:predicted ATPase